MNSAIPIAPIIYQIMGVSACVTRSLCAAKFRYVSAEQRFNQPCSTKSVICFDDKKFTEKQVIVKFVLR